ncbi:hypothetical protein [Sanguibacter suaedae]|uniref:Uncharacterized protein n=1 Tax=Sanguibacter suaedae TaxID=2795737 RepID=A0A934I8Y9_9MICO|nr:hypothetical protein [Sanguibacter suaedae]MBI9113415.1 hypothetical protein [Sanguibacter suaedae]
MTDLLQGAKTPPEALREQWRAASIRSVWAHPDDWYHPAVDAIVEAVVDGHSPVAACERLGASRSAAGCGITEAIDDLACLWATIGGNPPIEAVRALSTGWAENEASTAVTPTWVDAETGLNTVGYLAVRLREAYGIARRKRQMPRDGFALAVIDVSLEELAGWQRVARSASMGQILRDTFGDGHPMASLGGGTFVALCTRDNQLPALLNDLRILMDQDSRRYGLSAAVRQPARIWLESLPQTAEGATQLLAHLRH